MQQFVDVFVQQVGRFDWPYLSPFISEFHRFFFFILLLCNQVLYLFAALPDNLHFALVVAFSCGRCFGSFYQIIGLCPQKEDSTRTRVYGRETGAYSEAHS
jgi:hypothetical protein